MVRHGQGFHHLLHLSLGLVTKSSRLSSAELFLVLCAGHFTILSIGSMPYIRENPHVLVHGMCMLSIFSRGTLFSRRSSGLGTFGVLHLLPRALWPWHQHAFAVSDATWPWKDRSAGRRRSKKYISSFTHRFTSVDHFVALFCSQFPLNS